MVTILRFIKTPPPLIEAQSNRMEIIFNRRIRVAGDGSGRGSGSSSDQISATILPGFEGRWIRLNCSKDSRKESQQQLSGDLVLKLCKHNTYLTPASMWTSFVKDAILGSVDLKVGIR